jgi:hypothetical protein
MLVIGSAMSSRTSAALLVSISAGSSATAVATPWSAWRAVVASATGSGSFPPVCCSVK